MSKIFENPKPFLMSTAGFKVRIYLKSLENLSLSVKKIITSINPAINERKAMAPDNGSYDRP